MTTDNHSDSITALIVDDEAPARSRLRLLLQDLPNGPEILSEASDGKEAIELARKLKPDLLFLDIQMPVLDGFDVVQLLGGECPSVIFVTAYDEYALKAFEVHAVDYLLKPVRLERLCESVQRAMKQIRDKTAAPDLIHIASSRPLAGMPPLHKVPVNHKREILLIAHEEILWFEADGKLTWTHTADGKKYRCDFALSVLEERLRGTDFMRIHRSVIANLRHATRLEPWFSGGYRITLKDGTDLEVARRRVPELRERIGL